MIEVGDFIKTNEGIIGQVKRIELDNIDKSLKWYVFDRKMPDINMIKEEYINKPYIVKYSKNIIDLIEVGDIAEIELSEEFVEKEDKKVLTQIGEVYTKETLQRDIDNGIITKILTILTKEQYKQNCYTVERKEKC